MKESEKSGNERRILTSKSECLYLRSPVTIYRGGELTVEFAVSRNGMRISARIKTRISARDSVKIDCITHSWHGMAWWWPWSKSGVDGAQRLEVEWSHGLLEAFEVENGRGRGTGQARSRWRPEAPRWRWQLPRGQGPTRGGWTTPGTMMDKINKLWPR